MQRYTSKRVVVHDHQSMVAVLAHGFIREKEDFHRYKPFQRFLFKNIWLTQNQRLKRLKTYIDLFLHTDESVG